MAKHKVGMYPVGKKQQRRHVRVQLPFLILTVFMFIMASHYGGFVPYALLYMLGALVILVPFNIYFLRKSLRLQLRHGSSRYVSGAATNLNMVVRNGSRLPVSLFTCTLQSDLQGFEQQMYCSFAVPPRATSVQATPITMQYRGVYEFTATSGLYRDMWGIARFRDKRLNQSTKITVFPKLHQVKVMGRSRILSEHEERVLKRGFEESGLYSDIREYQPGDSQSRIHWKLSAARDNLMSKHYETSDDDELLLWLDMFRPNSKNSLQMQEKMMELVASVVDFCLRNAIPLMVCYHCDGALVTKEARTIGDFEMIYAALASAPFDEAVSLRDFIKQQMPVRETLVFTTQEDADFNVVLDNPNRRVEAFVVSNDNDKPRTHTPSHSLKVHTVAPDADVRRTLEVAS